ncbi:EAL domain-containing protein [Sphaerisporangium krabiense]|uniref:EAL domain-containing protein (Putative c-di-GMP-specific phosphodiesterase class I) n=1 Tax=Sphaerisporangium krabiense TaxID=763782 RepID=A0A7W8ZBP1_9ACTN|nr:EAL domain-containing protein [Sphaerisporangium krabiense]MBB5631066.1 EAL domain-containing protein (putative c-di-GMP-specific phosphodiesterase class I) [Sphaerisporangium krabiense]
MTVHSPTSSAASPLAAPSEARSAHPAPGGLPMFRPIVDLDTGGVIAVEAAAGGTPAGYSRDITPAVAAAYAAGREEARLPLVLTVPSGAVIDGSAALAPLHEAMRATRRRPREVILVVSGDFPPEHRRGLLVGIEGLRTIGYLVAIGGLGASHMPLDLVADASPYAAVLSPELVDRIPGDPRRGTLARAVAQMARGMGIHVLAPLVREEAQLTMLRRWGIRLAHGPLLAPIDWRPSHGRVHVPLPVPAEPEPSTIDLGPRVQEFLMPAVTFGTQVTAEEVADALAAGPSITSVILVDEYQRPRASVERGRFLLSIAGPYGHALHAKKPAHRLADPPRIVPKTTPAIAAMQVAGKDSARVYDDLVVVDEVGRCMGIVHVGDLIRHVADLRPAAP